MMRQAGRIPYGMQGLGSDGFLPSFASLRDAGMPTDMAFAYPVGIKAW